MLALRTLSVTWAMALLAFMGMAAVLTYALVQITDGMKHQSQLRNDALLTQIATSVGGMTHELQKERGASAGFIASGGKDFVEALPEQRILSDTAIEKMQAAVSELQRNAEISRELDALLTDLQGQIAELPVLRGQVDELRIELLAAVGTITRLNRSAIALLPEIGKKITHSDAARAVQRHSILMTAKDIVGLERATGATGFARAAQGDGTFPYNVSERFEGLIAEQTTLFSLYQSIASPLLVREIESLNNDDTSKTVVRMRSIALSGNAEEIGRIAPEAWFQAITGKINLIKELEDTGAAEITEFMNVALADQAAEIRMEVARMAGIGLVFLIGAAILVRRTSRAVEATANRVDALSEGDIDSEIIQAPQRDLNKITQALEKFQLSEITRREQEEVQKGLETSSADGIRRISAEVSQGNFQERLRLRDLKGATLILGNGINEILREAEEFTVRQRAKDDESMANQRIQAAEQERAIAALEVIVRACSSGDFSRRMETDGLKGVWKDVAEGINQIAAMTDTALNDIRGIMSSLATGDLNARMHEDYKGTFHEISQATNSTIGQLDQAFGNIREGVLFIGSATQELRVSSTTLTDRSEQQARTVADSTDATARLNSSIASNGKNLGQCKSLMTVLETKTVEGQTVAEEAVASMAHIEDASREMSKIVATIDEIAFQTNLLALNASVEAARAGGAGKGFAVVASEVRGLANRCADASRQIGHLITDSVDGVEKGAAKVRQTGEAITQVQDTLSKVATEIEAVLAAGIEQGASVNQLSDAIATLDSLAQSNVSMARENLDLTTKLTELEQRLSITLDEYLSSQTGTKVEARAA